jgi:hypothetical protein
MPATYARPLSHAPGTISFGLLGEPLGSCELPERTQHRDEGTMAITEQDRHRLYERLEQVLGPEEAATLMEHLPLIGWADVATKRDIEQLGTATKRDIEQLGTATKRDIGHLELDIDHVTASLSRDLELMGERLRSEVRKDLLQFTFAMFAANATLVGVAFGAAKLA